jgi:hypothetical protein
LVEKHGAKRRRAWRKLHLGVDAETGQIVASAPTSKEVDDSAQVGSLLDQFPDPLNVGVGTPELCSRRLIRNRVWWRRLHFSEPCTTLTRGIDQRSDLATPDN